MQSTQTCNLSECDQPVKRIGLCYGHYMKQWRYGDPRHIARHPKRDLVGQRFGSLTVQSYRRVHAGQGRWVCLCDCGGRTEVRTGDLNRGTVRSCGATHHHEHEVIEYSGAHDRVRRARGSASGQRCTDCGQAATHWSYDHADPNERRSETVRGNPTYSMDPDHYQARCTPCHKTFDLAHLSSA